MCNFKKNKKNWKCFLFILNVFLFLLTMLLQYFKVFHYINVLLLFGLVLLCNVGPVFLRHIYQLFQSCFTFNAASKAKGSYQFSGKITVKAKEKSYSKLEIPYQAEVLEGWVKLDIWARGVDKDFLFFFFIPWKKTANFATFSSFFQLLGLWPHCYIVPH